MSCSCFNFLLLASCSNSSVFLYSAIRSSFCFRNESWKLLFAVSPPSWAVLVMELFFLENNKAKKCPIERNIDVVEIVQDFSMFSTMRKLNNVRRILWKASFNHPSARRNERLIQQWRELVLVNFGILLDYSREIHNWGCERHLFHDFCFLSIITSNTKQLGILK